jgi:spore maturation protein CgeB
MHIPSCFTPQELKVRTQITEQIINEIREAHRRKPLDLFLSYFYNAHFDPTGFEEIHRLGIPTVNFYCNSIYQFDYVADIAAKVKFSWHAEKEAGPRYIGVGANPVWVQMGADPEVYHPVPKVARQAKACFVGQRYADRDRLFAALIRSSIPIDIYGGGWNRETSISQVKTSKPHDNIYLGRKLLRPGSFKSFAHTTLMNIQKHGVLAGGWRTIRQWRYRSQSRRIDPLFTPILKGFAKDISQTYAGYEVVVNFSNVWADGRPGSELIPHVRLRDFEAPMCRTCYITGHTEEIAEFYELGKEIDTYQSPEELVEKTRFYLAHPSQAEKIREAGYRRAVRDHTWEKRFAQLFEKLGMGA